MLIFNPCPTTVSPSLICAVPDVQMVLTRSARGLIRGGPVETVSSSANDGPGGRIAALLCFDELQITDTFTAVALKGVSN